MQPSQAWPAHAHDTRDLCAESTESPTQPGSHGPGCPPPVAPTPGPPASPPAERSRISLSSDLGGHPLRPTPTGTRHGSQAHRGHGGAEGRGTEGATFQLSSTQFSLSAMSNSLRSQGCKSSGDRHHLLARRPVNILRNLSFSKGDYSKVRHQPPKKHWTKLHFTFLYTHYINQYDFSMVLWKGCAFSLMSSFCDAEFCIYLILTQLKCQVCFCTPDYFLFISFTVLKICWKNGQQIL